jgi:hypothetical protein
MRFYVLDGQDLITGNSQDPLTLNDTAEPLTDPERTEVARRLFARFESDFVPGVRAREDDETLERLRALGYVR